MREGWEIKKLGEVCKLITCGVAARPEYIDDGIPFLSAKNVKEGQIIWNGFNCVSEQTHKELTKNNKPLIGDILYTRVGSFGEAAVIEDDVEFSIFVSLTLIKVDKNILGNYFLKYYLNSDFIKRLAKKSISGSGVGNLNVGTVREFPIFLPPLAEQQRIVSILDKAFTAIDKAKANAEKNLKNAKELFESYLQEVFENNTNRIGRYINFDEACNLVGGSQPSKDYFIYEQKEGYTRLIQVRDYRTEKFKTFIPKEKAKRFCTKEDIMIGRYGPPIFGIFKGLEGAYNVALMKAVIDENICDKNYFYWFLNTKKLRKFVEHSSKRAAGQDGVRKELLDKYPVWVCTLEEQKVIAQNLDLLTAETKRLESIYQQKLTDLEELKKSILQKAFSGELNTSDICA